LVLLVVWRLQLLVRLLLFQPFAMYESTWLLVCRQEVDNLRDLIEIVGREGSFERGCWIKDLDVPVTHATVDM
jgi:hypothetical protein